MTYVLLAAAAAAVLLVAPAFAQEGGSVFTNNPNELPRFFHRAAPNPDFWAGPFFRSQVHPDARRHMTAQREPARNRAVD